MNSEQVEFLKICIFFKFTINKISFFSFVCFPECILACVHAHGTGTVIHKGHTNCTGALSVYSLFGGNVWPVLMVET